MLRNASRSVFIKGLATQNQKEYTMYTYGWVLLAISLGICGSGQSQNLCFRAVSQFTSSHMMSIPLYCQQIQNNLTNDVSYRFNLSESTVNDICNESNNMICLQALQMISLVCATFVSMEYACSAIVYDCVGLSCSLKRILTVWTLPQ